jgi:DnaJ-class molecular chaperone
MPTDCIEITLGDEDQGEESRVVSLPTKFKVCPTCEGRGKHCQHLGAFTQDEMDEHGPDFREDYMAGVYDKTCETCDGQRVVAVVDRDAIAVSRNPDFTMALEQYDREQEADREWRAEQEAEMRYCYGPNY